MVWLHFSFLIEPTLYILLCYLLNTSEPHARCIVCLRCASYRTMGDVRDYPSSPAPAVLGGPFAPPGPQKSLVEVISRYSYEPQTREQNTKRSNRRLDILTHSLAHYVSLETRMVPVAMFSSIRCGCGTITCDLSAVGRDRLR